MAMPNWDWLWCAEIAEHPSRVLAARFGHVNLGDMTALDFSARAAEVGIPDVLVAGTPCFTADHMVLTERGYMPIASVKVGDMVVTHKGRLRAVMRTGSKTASVGVLSAVGFPEGVCCTGDHPFLSRKWRSQNTRAGGRYFRRETVGEPEWIPANRMVDRQWVSLTKFDVQQDRRITSRLSTKTAMAVAGMYLGDGWTRRFSGKNKKVVLLGLNDKKYRAFCELGVKHSASRMRTCIRVAIYDTALAEWLVREFGSGAAHKRIPAWVLSHQDRRELFRGYMLTDGTKTHSGFRANSVSRSLAFGMRDLAQTLDFVGSVALVETPKKTVIEGRAVNQRDYWALTVYEQRKSRKSRVVDDHLLRTVTQWRPRGSGVVYDLKVDEDHSFILDGAVVHNCQAFSVAGKRAGLADARGNLTLIFVRIVHDLVAAAISSGRRRPCVLWENVPGVLSTTDNAFGCFLGALIGADDALRSPLERGRWSDSGMVAGPFGRAAWTVKDAQHFGLAQRRERVFVVVDLGDGPDPAAVLFERKGGAGDYSPRSKTWEKPPARVAGGAGRGALWRAVAAAFADPRFGVPEKSGPLGATTQSGGFRTTDLDNNGAFVPEVTHALRGEGHDASEDGTGRGTPLVPEVAWALQERDAKGADSDTKEGHLIPEIVAIAMNLRGREGGAMPELDDKASLRAASGGSSRSFVATTADTPYGVSHGDAEKTRPFEALCLLRESVGTEAFTEWCLGVVAALQSPKVLRSGLYGEGFRPAPDTRVVVGRDTPARQKAGSEGAVRSLWSAACSGRAPLGWKPSEQLCRELATHLSALSRDGTQKAAFLQGMHDAASEIGILREALAKIQEIWRPIPYQDQSAHARFAVRRLTPAEAARLQGFPDDHAAIPPPGKNRAPDGPQYKAYGNSMAVPVIRWICERIERERIKAQ